MSRFVQSLLHKCIHLNKESIDKNNNYGIKSLRQLFNKQLPQLFNQLLLFGYYSFFMIIHRKNKAYLILVKNRQIVDDWILIFTFPGYIYIFILIFTVPGYIYIYFNFYLSWLYIYIFIFIYL